MLAGLEEVTEVTARWGEGIGRNSHTLELQELGELLETSEFQPTLCAWKQTHRHVLPKSTPMDTQDPVAFIKSGELLKLERVRISSNPLPPECRHLRHLFQSIPILPASRPQASRSRPPESEILILGGSSPAAQGGTGCHRLPNILAPEHLKSMTDSGNQCKSI